jgi:hypothetical protein
MKTPISLSLTGMIAGAALVLQMPIASAQNVNWSVTIGTPYHAPQPVYVEPQRVYVQPQRIYVQPQPVYVQSYAQPVAVVQYQNYYPQPYYAEPSRYRGHGHRGRHHGHRD